MGSTDDSGIWTTCATHCGGICRLKVHVRDNAISRIETDDGEEPQLRACLRGRAMRQRVYAPDRLKYPLRRRGRRGEGTFKRISWEEAIGAVASELRRVKINHGSGSIMLCHGGGNLTLVHGKGTTIERLLSLFGGYSTTWGWNSWEGATFASAATFGTIHVDNTRDDLLNSNLIILWGCDPATSIHSTNTMWYLIQAKEKGIKIVSVDPMLSDSAAILADQWIPIRPSTDTAMLLAMAYTMVSENLEDRTFINRLTLGFDRFKDYLMGRDDGVAKTSSWAEAITGVSAHTIEELAREYATTKPAAFIAGIAPGRTAMGEQYHRAAATLAAITGNIGIHGGNAAGRSHGDHYPFNRYPFKLGPSMRAPKNPIDETVPARKLTLKNYEYWKSSARVHRSKLADALLKGKSGGYPYDYKLLYVVNCNPVNQLPYTAKWAEALSELEFIVVQEQFLTATAKFADIVLPVCTFLERNDIIAGGGVPYYGYMKKIIEPLHETKSQLEIATMLAKQLNLLDFNDKNDEEWVDQIVKGSVIPDGDSFREKAIYRIKLEEPYVCFKQQIENPTDNPFPTPSGKIEIYSQQLADMNDPLIPAIPKYIAPWEGFDDLLARKYPLQLINKHARRRALSQLETLPWLREVQQHALEINTLDAKTRGINNGDSVRVFNDRGVIVVHARITERIMPGVVSLPQGAWYDPDEKGVDRGGCASTLLRDESSPCGALVTNTCLVEVQKDER